MPSWDCDGQGSCYDPGTGNGQYSSLSSCQSNCIVPSWDCDGGTCFDPGNGQGVYSTLQDCQYNCTNVLIEDFGLTNFKIYPNPSDNLFNIEFVSNRLQNLNIKVLNVLGEDVFVEYLDQFSGKYVQQVNLSNKAKGIYLLEIETNQGLINKKLILQ